MMMIDGYVQWAIATSEAEFMDKLCITEPELKKSVAYKKACIPVIQI